MTPQQLSRVKTSYSKIAGEDITVELIGGAIYVFCSELGTLRLFRTMPSSRQGYSQNRKTFYFSVEI